MSPGDSGVTTSGLSRLGALLGLGVLLWMDAGFLHGWKWFPRWKVPAVGAGTKPGGLGMSCSHQEQPQSPEHPPLLGCPCLSHGSGALGLAPARA